MTHPNDRDVITADSGDEAVREWFERIEAACRAVDYESFLPAVADDVVSFGTKAEVVQGVDHLRTNQWENIWPNTAGFTIEFDTLHSGSQTDLAWGVVTWTSTGFDEAGQSFERPGRATVILARREGAWVAIHTHFSLFPGIPHETYGPPAGRE